MKGGFFGMRKTVDSKEIEEAVKKVMEQTLASKSKPAELPTQTPAVEETIEEEEEVEEIDEVEEPVKETKPVQQNKETINVQELLAITAYHQSKAEQYLQMLRQIVG